MNYSQLGPQRTGMNLFMPCPVLLPFFDCFSSHLFLLEHAGVVEGGL